MTTYAIALQVKQGLDDALTRASRALQAVPGVGSGPMGLTPDAVRATPEYQIARRAVDEAFAACRLYNARFIRAWGDEYRADRERRLRAEAEHV